MAETTLRDYIRTIDSLIDAEKLDEAIAHCRNILQQHPKHLATYRLLGKAYLEAKKHGDAADIFQRVLSAVPDDFVSHIGMSIVREDEGNTESAIWHMERAFENNPSNPAIQQELKRLIGRRDGIEPPKVRLTRGALARMYSHGELYPQAIAELRSALREEPDRPDLQVLLADLYWQTDQRVEAAEVSSRVLEKLPYCQRALRIMASALQETGKAQEATRYHRRLAQLDPYFAYVESPMQDTEKVEADSVRVEVLSWQPGEPMPGQAGPQSDWASSLGLDFSEEEAEDAPLPAWLEDVSEGEPQEQEMPPVQQPVKEQATEAEDELESEPSAAALPDWMEEAGWEPASGEAQEGPVAFSAEELSSLERGELPAEGPAAEATDDEETELAPAELPGWLQDKAPLDEVSVEDELADADIPDWLDDLEPEVGADVMADATTAPVDHAEELPAPPWDRDAGERDEAEDQEALELPQDLGEVEAGEADLDELEPADVPSWLDEGEPGATSTIMSWLGERPDDEPLSQRDTGAPAGEAPEDWIEEAFGEDAEADEEPIRAEGQPPEAEPSAPPGIPSWLEGMAEASASSEEAEREELDRFRQETAATGPDSETEPEGDAVPAEIPDWLQQIAGGERPEPGQGPAAEVESEDLEEMDSAEPPEMEVELSATGIEETEQLQGELAEPQAEMEQELETPDWLKETFAPSDEAPAAQETPPEGTSAQAEEPDEVEDWLAGLATSEPTPEPVAPAEEDEVEDWLSGLAEPEPEPATTEEQAATWLADLGEEPQGEGQSWAEMTAQEPDWLEGLGEEEPADEVDEMAGGWLDDLSETLAETPAEPSTGSLELEEQDVPEWLTSFEDAGPQAQQPAGAQPGSRRIEEPAQPDEPEGEDLGWLQEIAQQAEGEPAQAPEPAPSPAFDMGELDQMGEDEIFEWLENMAAQQEQQPQEQDQPAPAPTPPRPTSPAAPVEEAEGEDLEWLAKLSEQRGIDADLQPVEPPTAAPPDRSRQAEMSAAEEQPAEEPAPAEELGRALPWHEAELEPEEPLEQPPVPPEPDRAEPVPSSFREEVHIESPQESEPPPLPPAEEAPPRPPTEPVEPAFEGGLPAEPPTTPSAPTPGTPDPEGEEEVPDWLKPMAQQPAAGTESAPTEAETAAHEEPHIEPAPSSEPARPEVEPAPPGPAAEPAPAEAVESGEPASEAPPAQPLPPQEPEERSPATAAEPVEPTAEPEPEPEPEPAVPAARVHEAVGEPEPDEVPEAGTASEPESETEAQPEPEPEPQAEPEPKLPERLHAARASLEEGDPRTAAGDYDKLLKIKEHLELVIDDLEGAVEDYPESGELWQTLGDAYMKAGRTKDAAQAYNEGMRETEVLESARQALAAGDHSRAAAQYSILIKDRKGLETVIEDLEAALEYEDDLPIIWQTLGDAYMKAGRLTDSIKAYRKGMDSV